MANSIFDWLDRYGLGSSNNEDLAGAKPKKRKLSEAVCYSEECSHEKWGKKAVPKDVPFATIFCVQCGSALFWRTKRKRRKLAKQ
jgi:hypothetical protein